LLLVTGVVARIQEALEAIEAPFTTALDRARTARLQEKTVADAHVEPFAAARNELEESAAL